MTTNEFVPKSELFTFIRNLFNQRETGLLTLLTDAKQSVLVRFTNGEITSARCKKWDIGNTIQALLQTDQVKYSYVRCAEENKPILMLTGDFLMKVDPDGLSEEALAAEAEALAPDKDPQDIEANAEDAATVDDDEGKAVDRAIAAKMNFL